MSQAIAYDRSLRHRDAFGRMKVELTNISKANVCPYYGREIPNHEALGLDANKVYRLYRHPDELAAGAHTFDMVPVLDEHLVVDSENPEKEAIAGTTGSGAKFVYPYLKVPMAVWVGDSVTEIRAQRKRQLSCGYVYTADMTPGVTREGVAYDGVMRHIIGNHVALVHEGRAGPDVMVADEMPAELKEFKPMKRALVVDAVLAAMAVTAPTPEQKTALDVALDAAMCSAEQKAATDAKEKADKEAYDADPEAFEDDPDNKGKKRRKAKKAGMDSAVVPSAPVDSVTKAEAQKMATDAATAAVAAERALHAARADVADVVGAVALDSAEAVYRFALKEQKVTGHDSIHVSALPALWAQVKAGKTSKAQAQDSAATDAKASPDALAMVSAIGF